MCRHHIALNLRPVIGRHFKIMYSDEKKSLICRHHFSGGGQLKRGFSSRHLWAGIVDVETGLLKQLSASRCLEALAGIDGTSGGCPESLTGKRPALVLEPKQKKPMFAV